MPGGGRGTIEAIGISLNGGKHKELAETLIDDIKGGHYQVIASLQLIANAVEKCDNLGSLNKVWCAAKAHNRVEWAEY